MPFKSIFQYFSYMALSRTASFERITKVQVSREMERTVTVSASKPVHNHHKLTRNRVGKGGQNKERERTTRVDKDERNQSVREHDPHKTHKLQNIKTGTEIN